MDLPNEKIDNYNKIFQEKFGRDATEEEIIKIERDLRRLAEIIYESYLYHLKTGKLPEILKEIELEKNKKSSI